MNFEEFQIGMKVKSKGNPPVPFYEVVGVGALKPCGFKNGSLYVTIKAPDGKTYDVFNWVDGELYPA